MLERSLGKGEGGKRRREEKRGNKRKRELNHETVRPTYESSNVGDPTKNSPVPKDAPAQNGPKKDATRMEKKMERWWIGTHGF